MNEQYYLLTGAAGFLGSNICAQLLAQGKKVRALVLPNDKSVKYIPQEVEVVLGDLCDAGSLEPFFAVPEGCTSVIIHCASMVTVDPVFSDKLMAVNEPVTLKEICDMLQKECNAKRIAFYLPLGLAHKIAKGMEKKAEKTGKKPMMTTFSVYNLERNNVFDYSKAVKELGYKTRPYQQTIHDEVQWMIEEGLIQP